MKKSMLAGMVVAATQAMVAAGAQPAAGELPGRPEAGAHDASTPMPAAQRSDELRVSVRFGGGTVLDYIRQIKASANGRPVNVAFGTDAAAAQLAPIELENVDVRTALEAISPASDQQSIEFKIKVLGGPEIDGPRAPAYAILAAVRRQEGDGQVEVRVSSIRGYLGDAQGEAAVKKAGVLVSAIEAALTSTPNQPHTWQVKFHADSGLLILRGTADEINTAQVVVSEVMGDVKDLNRENATIDRARQTAEENFRKVEAMMAEAERRYEIAQERLKKVRHDQPDGDAIGAAEQQVAAAEEEIRYRRDQVRRCEQALMFPTREVQSERVRDMEKRIADLQAELERLRAAMAARSGSSAK